MNGNGNLRIWASAALLAVVVSACSRSGPAAHPDEAEIRAVLQDQVAAWNRADLAGFMEGYARQNSTRFASGDTVVQGWQPVFDRYRKRYTNATAMGHLVFFDVKVDPVSADAALVHGHWRLERRGSAPTGVFTLLFRLFPEGWRIVHDHTSQAGP